MRSVNGGIIEDSQIQWAPGPLNQHDPNPPITLESPDSPPFSHPARTAAVVALIVALSQPPDPLPFNGGRQPSGERVKLNAALLHNPTPQDDPPFSSRRLEERNVILEWHNYKSSMRLMQGLINPAEVDFFVKRTVAQISATIFTTHIPPFRMPQTRPYFAPIAPFVQQVDPPPQVSFRRNVEVRTLDIWYQFQD